MSAPAIPRPAATLLIVRDDPLEVLMVRRAATGSFASAWVFPGGTVDPADRDPAWLPLLAGAAGLDAEARGWRIAALRESFEEAGLLVGHEGPPPAPGIGRDFRGQVAVGGGRLRLDALVPFARWITPEAAPRRWDTHFFLARAPAGQAAACDGIETLAAAWRTPAAALALGDRDLPFPTRLNLMLLARSGSFAAAAAAAAARPVVAVMPRFERRAGGEVALIPIEAGYGAAEYPRGG